MVRDVDFDLYFTGIRNKHMIMTNICKSDLIPAVSHIDNTARVQVLSKDHRLYSVLTNLSRGSNRAPVICNTSLNGRDQPIYNSLEQVIALTRKNPEISFILLDNGLLIREEYL